MQIYAPVSGGLNSKGARYPGFDLTGRTQRTEIRCGEMRLIHIKEGDLVTLTDIDGDVNASIAAVTQTGNDALA
ncbi:MAG: hypothetical protein K5905_20945, partial [Roseibium sp.]|uniref:hypothetical protein n=1 Tax=Roseibium sp. TaxID=1936156 RepID=UPI00262F7DD7